MNRYGLSWDGEITPSPHGDFYLVADVERAIADQMSTILDVLPAPKPAPEVAERVQKLFGYVDPEQAVRFLAGRLKDIRVYKRKCSRINFRIDFEGTPKAYIKPAIGSRVITEAGSGIVKHHGRDCIHVLADDGSVHEVFGWRSAADANPN